MTKRTNTTKTTIYRRHAATCPVHDQPLNLAACECPLWIHGKVSGKFIRKSLDTRKLSTAELRQSDHENNRTGVDVQTMPVAVAPNGGVTLEYAATEFSTSKDRKASNTQKLYNRAVTHFVEWAAQRDYTLLAHIDLPQIRQYFRECAKDWKRSTAQTRLVHLRVWFNYCLRTRRWIQFSPAADRDLNFSKAKAGKSATTKQRMPFSPVEIARILAAAERMPEATRDRARALVYLLLYTGMRISDATFFERSFLTERHTALYYIIKTRKLIEAAPEVQKPALDALAKLPASRVYFFQPDRSDDYAEARQALREEANGDEFSLAMPDYLERIRETTALVLKVLRLAGITGACHRFRDTFAVSLLMGGTDIYTVSKMLGHSDVRITDSHYVKFLPDHASLMSQKTRCLNYGLPLTEAA